MALMLKPIISISNSNELRHVRKDKIELDVKGIIKNCHMGRSGSMTKTEAEVEGDAVINLGREIV